MPLTKKQEGDFRKTLRIIQRHWRLFCISSGICAVALLIAAHFIPLQYTSKAVFEFGLEAAAEQISRTSRDSFGTVKERLQYDLAGYNAVKRAVEEVGLTQGLPHDSTGSLTDAGEMELQRLVEKTMDNIHVEWEARSKQEDLVAISFTHHDPEIAQQIPNALVSEYINRTYQKLRQGLKRQHEFLQRKVSDVGVKIEELTEEKVELETECAGILPEDPNRLQERMQKMRTKMDAIHMQKLDAEHRVEQVQSVLRRTEEPTTRPDQKPTRTVMVPNPDIPEAKKELRQLTSEMESAVTIQHMKAEHPRVEGLATKIAVLKKRIDEMPAEVVKETVYEYNPLNLRSELTSAKAEIASAEAELQHRKRLLKGYNALWEDFPRKRKAYLRFLMRWNNAQEQLKHWRERLEGVEVALGAAVNNRLTHLNTVLSAQRQYMPSFPPIWAVLGLTLAGSIALGIGAAFLANTLDSTISTPEEARQYFRLPVHGVTSEIHTSTERMVKFIRRWTLGPAVAVVLCGAIGIAGMSIVLRLRYTKKYEMFQNSPVAFICDMTGLPETPEILSQSME